MPWLDLRLIDPVQTPPHAADLAARRPGEARAPGCFRSAGWTAPRRGAARPALAYLSSSRTDVFSHATARDVTTLDR